MEIITGQITEYNEYRNQVAEMVKTNAATVFDYDSDKGEKEARSYVYKLRQSKSAIDKKRKELGEDLVARKKLIDSEAKKLIEAVEGMIDVHMKPLEEKAERERLRMEEIERKMQFFGEVESSCFGADSNFIKEAISKLENYQIEGFDERIEEAQALQYKTLERVSKMLDDALRIEHERAELERLRKEAAEREAKEQEAQAERDRIANEERLQREADERAKKAAEEAAQAQIRKAQQEALEKQRAAEEAQRKAEAEAQRIKLEAESAEAKRIADAKAKADADAKRAADIEHRKKINNAALKTLIEHAGLTEEQAKEVIKSIASGLIDNVSISY